MPCKFKKSYPERALQEEDCWLVSSFGNPSLAIRTDPVAILNRSKASSLPLSMVRLSITSFDVKSQIPGGAWELACGRNLDCLFVGANETCKQQSFQSLGATRPSMIYDKTDTTYIQGL